MREDLRRAVPINGIEDTEGIISRGHFGYYPIGEILRIEYEEDQRKVTRKESYLIFGVQIIVNFISIFISSLITIYYVCNN